MVLLPSLFSQRLAISSFPRYREFASLIRTIVPSGFLAMCPFFLGLKLAGANLIVTGSWVAWGRSRAAALILLGVQGGAQTGWTSGGGAAGIFSVSSLDV